MLTRLEVVHFKGFATFGLPLTRTSILIGPNNAGKSTLISALRSAALMLRFAQRRRPVLQEDEIGDTMLLAYPFSDDLFEVGTENLRHDFRPGTTSIELHFDDPRLQLRCIWPDSGSPHFIVIDPDTGWQPQTPKQLRELGNLIGVIPSLSPLEPIEPVLESDYLRRNIGGRLSSRHFRNQLSLLASRFNEFNFDWGDYVAYCGRWAAEVTLDKPTSRKADDGYELDFFFNEGRGPREITWAGDGFQVWLQMLMHLLRLRTHRTIVLDEPEVYLHPDLQRRLVRALDELPGQAIVATHSPEIATEVDEEHVVLVDRLRTRGVPMSQLSPNSQQDLGLGTRHNFALARSLRARLSLFVEGDDATILRRLAGTCEAIHFAGEIGLTVLRLQGIDNRSRLAGFGWLAQKLFGGALHGYVILDRDFRMPQLLDQMKGDVRSHDLAIHVWQRKELESYLLVPEAISRITGASAEWVQDSLEAAAADLRQYVQAQYIAVSQANRDPGEDFASAAQRALEYLEVEWGSTSPLYLCPARKLLSELNTRLQADSYRAVSIPRLAREMTLDEIPPEMRGTIGAIEELLSA